MPSASFNNVGSRCVSSCCRRHPAQLALMVPGLVPYHRALRFLFILERLCSVKEAFMQDKAVEAVNRIVPLLLPRTDDDKRGNYEDLKTTNSKRLVGADCFTPKVSVAGVLPAVYAFWNVHADSANANVEGGLASNEESRLELRLLFKDLSEDDILMVRKSVAKYLGRFVEAVVELTETAGVIAGLREINSITVTNKTLVQADMVPIFQASRASISRTPSACWPFPAPDRSAADSADVSNTRRQIE